MSLKVKQLNPFELKSALIKLLEKINSVSDIENCLADIDMLDAQDNKIVMAKLLFKELACASAQKIPLICFLLEHFISKEELIKGYWDMLNNKTLQPDPQGQNYAGRVLQPDRLCHYCLLHYVLNRR